MEESGTCIMIKPEINTLKLNYYTLDEAFELTKISVEKLLIRAPHMVREYTMHLSESQGKFVRARGLLVCAQNSLNEIHENAVSLAVSIEILHLATLVHDDIIDDSDLRRGKETLQKKIGKKKAVICGDYLLSLALKNLFLLKEKEKYTEFFLPNFVSRLCLGELEEYSNNGNLEMSTLKYLKIIRGKTAALFEGAFLAGAIFSGEEEKNQSQYAKLGRYIGMIFQLSDDCLDFEASEVEAKKPVGKDYEVGVITLPLIFAIKQNIEFSDKIKTGKMKIEEIIRLVIKFDGIGFAKGISKGYYKKAGIIIDKLEINALKKSELIDILEKSHNGITK